MAVCLICWVLLFINHHHHVHCQRDSSRQVVPTLTSPAELASPSHDVADDTGQFQVTTDRTKTSTCELPGDTIGGDCLQHVFDKYGENGVLTLPGFEKLLRSIGLSSGESHSDEDHEGGHDDEDEYDAVPRAHFEATLRRQSMSSWLKTEGGRESVTDVGTLDAAAAVRKDTHKRSAKNRRTRMDEDDSQYFKVSRNRLNKRDVDFQETYDFSESGTDSSSDDLDVLLKQKVCPAVDQCLTPERYFEISSYHSDINQDTIDQSDFIQICPILIQQLDSQSCHKTDDHSDHAQEYADKTKSNTPAQVWGYGFLAITIISLVSLCGILIVPVFRRFPEGYKSLLAVLVALAVGTLSGDAVLHLIPHSYGLHAHEEEGGEHSNHDDNKAQEAVFRGLVVLLGIYLFFMVERLMHMYSDRKRKKKKVPTATLR